MHVIKTQYIKEMTQDGTVLQVNIVQMDQVQMDIIVHQENL